MKAGVSLGGAVILIYLIANYLAPAVVIWLVGFESLIYRQPELNAGQLFYGVVLTLVVVGACFGKPADEHVRVRLRSPHIAFWLAIILPILYYSALGLVQGMARWRYSGQSLSEDLSLVSMVYVLAPQILEFLIFLQIFFFRPNTPAERVQHRIVTVLLIAGLALTASGIGPMLTVSVVALYLIFPAQFRLLVFREREPDPESRMAAALGLVPMAAISVVLLVSAYVLGEQIKTGAERSAVTAQVSNLTVRGFLTYLLERFSTSWISLTVALSNYTTVSWAEVGQNLWAPIGNFLFRLDLLLGSPFSFDRPYIGSLMRLNYMEINYYPLNAREGTSPGLLATFPMAFPIPFSLVAAVLYTLFIRWVLNLLAKGMAGTPTLLGSIIVLYFSTALFASPVDFFLVLDNAFLALVLFAGTAMFVRRKMKEVGRA